MLVANQLLFFLKISNYLCETLFQHLDFLFRLLDLLCLELATFCILLFSALLDIQVSFQILILILLLVDCSFVIVDFVTLGNCFLCPFLVLQMDVFLNDLNV